MSVDWTNKRVLVLSDNDRLSQAIGLNLNGCRLETIPLAANSPLQEVDRADVENFDLIVLAMSSLASEPVIALARASLVDQIGRVPLLIISSRPFQPDLRNRIVHLHFPFDLDMLCDKVKDLLQWEPELSGVAAA